MQAPSGLLLSLFGSIRGVSFDYYVPGPIASRVGVYKALSNGINSGVTVDSSSGVSLLMVTDAHYLSGVSKLGMTGSFDEVSCSLQVSSMSPNAVGDGGRLHSV